MRAGFVVVAAASAAALAGSLAACGSSSRATFDGDDGGGSSGSSGSSASSGGSSGFGGDSGPGGGSSSGDGGVTMTSTIYANTDDTLYALDPSTNALTAIGTFSGSDGNVTDCAVDANGDVYVNTSDAIYRAALPSGGKGNVALTKIATIAATSGQKFYALAFAPAGVLGASETLVGGDDHGELWSIDSTSGALKDLGSFGPDKTSVFALSGDIVFYTDSSGKPTGLATIRDCKSGGTNCTTTNDYLAGVDMTALSTAYSSGKAATSLLSGIYGGSATSKGSGIMHGEIFGLGAWEGSVFGFERASANGGVPALLSIDTTSGAGKILPGNETFTNGWSGACVTTKVNVIVPPPPPPPN